MRWLSGFLTLWLSFAGSALWAEELPAAFRVTGVAATDVLNIRAEPEAEATILGSIPHNSSRVEVLQLSPNGKWGMVGNGEGNGWVAMKYLQPVAATPADQMPVPLRCLGTEPFWSFAHTPQKTWFLTPEAASTNVILSQNLAAGHGYFASGSDESGRNYHLIVTRERCSDGMSDRLYGFSARLFRQGGPENLLYSGCCTLDGR